MKQLLLVSVCLIALCIYGCNRTTPAEAHTSTPSGHSHPIVNDNEEFDYGLFSDFIKKDVFKTEKTATHIGLRSTYFVESEETRISVGSITEF